ncbi:flagellar hook-length control protein FliK [Peribacillus huizhouensis]|uniref:Flagellar hook-length control protein FliK n=1 Tax=Peribacillus huizhouensis TaxID=1501239 RepID=A0ABR6CIW3_9BACI|nr:flagellar hook-length control protein FliK [Peribacillus huizhouensis]MBA9024866.1 flagellar hook-length control protein FliK [Peribacillus huizhouensis]
MNAGMIMASVSASASKNHTVSKKPDIEHSFGNVLGKVILSKEAEDAEPNDVGRLTKEQRSLLNELIKDLKALSNPDNLLGVEPPQLIDKSSTEEENLIVGELLNSVSLNERDVEKMLDMLNEKISENEEIDVTEILPFLTTLSTMSENQWSELDLNKVGNILKFTKLQEAMISLNQITDNEAAVSKTLKHLLETILPKLESMVESEQQKSSETSTFNKLLASGASDLIQNTYIKNFESVNRDNEKKLVHPSSIKGFETTQTGQSFIPQMSKLEQFVLTVEKSGQPVTQEQFVKAFETILNKSSFTNANGTQKLFIQLNPEHLGALRIELIQKNDVMIAKIMTTTAQAKEMLESQLSGLKHSFVGQGIQVEKIEISQQLSTFSQERFYQRDSDASEQQNQQQNQKAADDDVTTEFTNQFEEALLNVEV